LTVISDTIKTIFKKYCQERFDKSLRDEHNPKQSQPDKKQKVKDKGWDDIDDKYLIEFWNELSFDKLNQKTSCQATNALRYMNRSGELRELIVRPKDYLLLGPKRRNLVSGIESLRDLSKRLSFWRR
jgi:hypothetical protein